MPDLPKKKVGIVACSGEELPEGTVTRLAALKVLEQLRPADTVTICLPLFLAGGEGDRAFARFYPTVAVDGCDKRCAARATAMYSGKPAASVVVSDLVAARAGLGSARRLNGAGMQAVDAVADQVAQTVDELLGFKWDRSHGQPSEEGSESKVATCECGSGIPVQKVQVDSQEVTLIALPLIFAQFRDAGKMPGDGTEAELMQTVKIYNPIPDGQEAAYAEAIMREYTAFCEEQEVPA
ncbi:MAG: putative zinc-binding protein [Anaerolineae bacterium]